MPDGVENVRATLTRLQVYDRDLLEKLPGTRAVQLRFRRRMLGGLLSRGVARVRAQALAPIEALVAEQPTGPVGREQVLDALARYELLPQRERPTGVILASATGFTAEAKALVAAPGPASLILMGGREDGGWDVTMPDRVRQSPWAKLLEFETQDDRLQRLQYHLERDAALLDSRGISTAELSEKLGLPAEQTETLVRRVCRTDSRLMTVVHEGKVHLCRSPLSEESNTMSIWSRIRRLLRLKPTAAERVRELTGKRVAIEQQRHEVDQRINVLEAEERDAIGNGAAAKSDAEKKQIAHRLVRVRRDLRRARSQATVYTQQIDILGTHIHNLTLAEQGRRTELPKAEDLTREAAEAEQVVGELAANAELAAGIEVGAPTPAMEEEEAAILAEFEQVAQREAASSPTRRTPRHRRRRLPSVSRGPRTSRPPSERKQPDPEMGSVP